MSWLFRLFARRPRVATPPDPPDPAATPVPKPVILTLNDPDCDPDAAFLELPEEEQLRQFRGWSNDRVSRSRAAIVLKTSRARRRGGRAVRHYLFLFLKLCSPAFACWSGNPPWVDWPCSPALCEPPCDDLF